MISKEKVDRYLKYNGDFDKWSNSQKKKLDKTLTGQEWTTIDKAFQRIVLERRGTAPKEYKEETVRVLAKTFESQDLIDKLREFKPTR